MNHENTTPTERRIARRMIETALKQGYRVSVYDGIEAGDWTVTRSNDLTTILSALATTEGDTLAFSENATGSAKVWERVGTVALIWGNDADLIHDHTDNDAIRALVAAAQEAAI